MNLFTERAKSIARILLHFLFPVSCEVCGRPGVSVCPECLPQAKTLPPERMMPLLFEGEVISREVRGVKVYAASDSSKGIVRESLRRMKYEREICRPIGVNMARKFGECEADCIIPVPLHLYSKRSYNHAREIAEGMREALGIELLDAGLWTREIKHKDSVTYEDFRLTRDIYGKKVAIVDDECISGRTLASFAETCRRDGAEVVCAYVFACESPAIEIKPVEAESLSSQSYTEKRYRDLAKFFGGEIITRNLDNLTVYSASNYHESGIREEIHKMKYTGGVGLCHPLGKHMAEKFGKCIADYLVPVPLHLFSDRGYNQSLKLCEGMCELWNAEILDAAEWTRDIPRRAASEDRENLLPEDFRIKIDLRGKRIALVDDVCTSGMTLTCLAETCRRAGAIVVCAYTLASV